jgi:hypothetical protein
VKVQVIAEPAGLPADLGPTRKIRSSPSQATTLVKAVQTADHR